MSARGPHGVTHAHGLHGPVDDPLVERLEVGRHLGHTAGDREHRARPARPPGRRGWRSRPPPPRSPDIESPVSMASIARRSPSSHGCQAMSGELIEPHRRVADLGVLGDVDQVARGGQLRPAGQAVAVHLGDQRGRHVHHLEPALQHVAGPAAVAPAVIGHGGSSAGSCAEVVAGREARTAAPDDDHPDVRVGVGIAKGGEQLAPQRVPEGVALRRAVQRQAADRRRRARRRGRVAPHRRVPRAMSVRPLPSPRAPWLSPARVLWTRIYRPITSAHAPRPGRATRGAPVHVSGSGAGWSGSLT